MHGAHSPQAVARRDGGQAVSGMTYKKLAYHAEMRAQFAERRVAELEAAIAAHRKGVEDGDWRAEETLWRVLPRTVRLERAQCRLP